MGKLPRFVRSFTVTLTFYLLFSTSFASSASAQNKMGINIGTQLDKFDQAAEVVGDGGWIAVIICPGDVSTLASLISSYPKINIVIRGHYPGQRLSGAEGKNWALSWVATLGNLSTPNQIYFMPWNEPNQTGSDDWGSPAEVVSYINHLTAFLDEARLRGKVKLLSPMINQSHPNFSSYIQDVKSIDPNFFSLFDGIAMNLYDFGEEDCGQPLCGQDPHRNPQRFDEILNELGAPGKPVFGVESATSGQNFYFKVPPSSNSPLYRFIDAFRNAGVEMFAIPAYDLAGEVGHTWNLFSPPDTANLMRAVGQQQGPCCLEPASSSWNQDFISNHGLIVCPNGITIGPDENYCSSCAAPLQPRLSCPTAATDETDSRPNLCEPCLDEAPTYPFCAETPTISQALSFPASAGPDLSLTLNGTFSLDLSSLEIPFVGKEGEEQSMKYIADYFEGSFFDYHYGQKPNNPPYEMLARSGVFRKLAPPEIQDQLKKEMVLRASGYTSNPVHDYLVTNYTGETARLSEFLNNLKPKDSQGQSAWKQRDGGKWHRLWPHVPMFTREDSPGQVTIAVEQPGNVSNPGPFNIQVPHVARLYEITKQLSEILMPDLSQSSSNPPTTQTTSLSHFPSSRTSINDPTPPKALVSANLLTNPNFEEGFSERGAGEIVVANGWEPWYRPSEGPGAYHRPEYDKEDGEAFTDPLRVCRDRFAQKFSTTFSTHEAGFYQQVAVPANNQVAFSAWGLAWSSGQNDPKSCAEPGNYRLSVGIDPAGGTDPYSPDIVWSAPSLACNSPVLLTATTMAQGSTVTVFTKGAPEWPVKHNDSYWDNACLVTGTSVGPECLTCSATGGGEIAKCEYPEATTGEGDLICVDGETGKVISTQVTAVDTITHTPKSPEEIEQCRVECVDAGGDPNQCYQDCAFSSHTVSRKIGITVNHPYLYESWKQTVETAQGLFNIFRVSNPELAPPPNDDTPAYGTVKYSFSGGSIDKEEAKLYFPFLEAIRRLKEWVANEVLVPRTAESS